MDYKYILEESVESAVTAYTKYILSRNECEECIICFFEGKDKFYYQTRIEQVSSADRNLIRSYTCNGKEEVRKVHKMINKNVKKKQKEVILYFCDKDYDIDQKEEEIYYTPYYSIENLYCLKAVAESILTNIFGLNTQEKDFIFCMNLFLKNCAIFNKTMKIVNAFCYSVREMEKQRHMARSPFNLVRFRAFTKVAEIGEFEMKELNVKELTKIFDLKISISESQVIDNSEKFNKLDSYTNFRGKWQLEFFCWYFDELRKSFKKGEFELDKRNVKVDIGSEPLYSLSHFAYTPQCLVEYIRRSCEILIT